MYLLLARFMSFVIVAAAGVCTEVESESGRGRDDRDNEQENGQDNKILIKLT